MHRAARFRAGHGCLLAGILLLCAAAGLVVYNTWQSARAGAAAQSALAKLTDALSSQMHEETQDAEAARERPSASASLEVEGYRYAGIVSIPALRLELPVMEDWDERDLRVAPCRYAGSAGGGDLVIAGHNYRSHFGPLRTLDIGSAVSFYSAAGVAYDYVVDGVELLAPWQVSEMTCGDWDLTLFTCTTSGDARVAIRCVRSS
ncbi:MAG: sortase [Oscillospiraceae bacterium]|nr:sortase [Oscillospiraceae bacterium]